MRSRPWLLSLSAIPIALSLGVSPSPTRLHKMEIEAYRSVNHERALHGLPELPLDPVLSEVARAHSEDMARRGYFSHYSPEGDSALERAGRCGLEWQKLGENIHSNDSPHRTVEIAVRSWMESRGHRETLLDPAYESTGMGCAVGARGVVYFTQVFMKAPEPSVPTEGRAHTAEAR